jgi:rubrerythrin
MPQESKLLQLITEQIDVENEYVECLTELRRKVGIAAARLLLLEMCLDSEKRAAILAEMRGILRKAPPNTALWEHTLEEYVGEALMKKEFQQYVKKESDTLECLKKELMHTKDEGLKLLWQNIEEDEKKHARIIQTIIKNLYKID